MNENNAQQKPNLARVLRLRMAYEELDKLHSAICEDRWQRFADFDNDAQLISLLEEMRYIAQESINELKEKRARRTPNLRILEKPVVALSKERAE